MSELAQEPKNLLDLLITQTGLNPNDWKETSLVRVTDTGNLAFSDHDPDFPSTDRFVNALAVFAANVNMFAVKQDKETEADVMGDDGFPVEYLRVNSIRSMMLEIDALAQRLDDVVNTRIHEVLRTDSFRELEANWRSLEDLVTAVTSNEIIIDFIDATKEEMGSDLQDHSAYILNSALFRKIYVDEYDRYGGRPIGTMIGLYEFDSGDDDIDWLETMSRVSAAAHCPFIAAAGPEFFEASSWEDLERKDDIEALLALPQFGRWDRFRHSDEAAYIGLTLPRYMLRAPYQVRGSKRQAVAFTEEIRGSDDYLWGNAAILFARNMVRSFQDSGWCQHVAGPRGGGLVKGLPVHMMVHHGQEELQPPTEIAIADYRELQFANSGFIPLIHCKGTADATFFSARSAKKALEFEKDLDTKNADLVCNLAYTLSITRIAHYVKRMVRDYIGSTADAPYIQAMLEAWLIGYVTTAVNPDDLTLLYYPFKAMSVSVEPKPGPFGWYKCIVSVLPHVQFQGMDVELRLEAALGGA